MILRESIDGHKLSIFILLFYNFFCVWFIFTALAKVLKYQNIPNDVMMMVVEWDMIKVILLMLNYSFYFINSYYCPVLPLTPRDVHERIESNRIESNERLGCTWLFRAGVLQLCLHQIHYKYIEQNLFRFHCPKKAPWPNNDDK